MSAKARQIEVGLDLASPPPGTTIEGFPELSLFDATMFIHLAKQKDKKQEKGAPALQKGGVQKEDWSEADQKRMAQGKRPMGTPLHRNL